MCGTPVAGYVIMIAGANEISQSSVGLVYFCAIFPTLLVKLTGPYWCKPLPMHICSTLAVICYIALSFSSLHQHSHRLRKLVCLGRYLPLPAPPQEWACKFHCVPLAPACVALQRSCKQGTSQCLFKLIGTFFPALKCGDQV